MKSLPLELTPEQFADLEKLSGIAFTPEKIALYFGIPEVEFVAEFNDPDSKIRHHYDKGLLQATADVNKGTLKRAKDGNLSSIAQLSKELLLQKLDTSKKRRMFEAEKSNYQKLQAFIQEGKVKDIPEEQLEYFEQLDYIRCLYAKYESKSYILSAVELKWPEISKYKANKLFSECLNFFYLDNEVKIEAWQNIYAENLDNMARICYDMNDFETARRCINDAAKMRGIGEKKDDIPEQLLDRRPIFYTIKIEDLGLPKADRRELARFIDNLPISEAERRNCKRDARIEDVPFEIFQDDGQD